jgi:nucleotide-binding universal stress UspA family protein
MYKHLLIATDGSELAQKAVDQGLALAKALDAKTTTITVTQPWTAAVSAVYGEGAIAFPVDDYEKAVAADASKILSAVNDAAKKAVVTCVTIHVKDRFPAEGIIETAKACGCDLIVMASHGRRGLRRLILGSQANEVATQSTIPVLICR